MARPRWRHRLRLVAAVLLVLAALCGVALVLLPEILRQALITRLEIAVAAPVRIADVALNPFAGRLRVTRLAMGGSGGARPFLAFAALDLRVRRLALLRGRLVFDAITVERPRLLVERTGPLELEVLGALQPGRAGEAGLPLTVGRLDLRDGELSVIDRTLWPHAEYTLTQVHVAGRHLSTAPAPAAPPATFDVRARLGGGSIAVAGTVAPLPAPSEVEVTVRWREIDPLVLVPYLPTGLRLDLTGGRLAGEARYVRATAGARAPAHFVEASLDAGAVAVRRPGDAAPTLAIGALSARDLRIDLIAGTRRVGELSLREPRLVVRRERGGAFDLASLLPVPRAGSENAAVAPGHLEVGRLTLESGTLELVDRAVRPAVTATLEDLRLSINDLVVAEDAPPARVEGSARLDGASVRVHGTLRARPPGARFTLEAKNVVLERYRGYLESLLGPVEVRGGRLKGRLDLAGAPPAGGAPGATSPRRR